MLSVSQLTKQVTNYSGLLTILDQVSFHVPDGQSLAIVGASGSGKSTLLSLLAGLDQPSSGEITMMDQKITSLDEDARAEFRAQHVGFIFQSFHLLSTLTALENVALPLELKQGKRAKDVATRLLQEVDLGERLNHYPNQMSGGEQQRVAIARAFAAQPRILFADEPTGNLDTKTGQHIADLLFDMNQQQGTTLILVTHDLQLADRCDRCIQLSAGKLVADSELTQATANDEHSNKDNSDEKHPEEASNA